LEDKLQVNKKLFLQRLNLLTFIKQRMNRPNLSNIKMVAGDGQMTLIGHDEINIVVSSFQITGGEVLSVIVPFRELLRMVKSHKATIDITVTEHAIFLASEGVKNKLVLGQGGYPKDPIFNVETTVELNSVTLRDAIKRALSASSKNKTRPELSGVLFGKTIVGADGHNIALSDSDLTFDFLIDSQSATLVLKNIKGTVQVGVNDLYAIFKTETCTIYCTQFDSNTQIIPFGWEIKPVFP